MIKVEYTDENSMMDSMVDEMSPNQTHSPGQQQQQQRLGSFDVESGFEPQTRARSNTWPLPRPEGYVDGNIVGGCGVGGMNIGKDGLDCNNTSSQPGTINQNGAAALLPVKKNSSRRNAWGNLSYADLITQAITSATDNRLTLSQIYEWMVHNVPYFKDKGDSNSSAGWKNSIRHNLSLHNRFMRVQNEGTGKSSWWMINPDAKPGKSARRRATSMETSKFEKRRGRVKKKVEALRNNGGLQADATPSPSSSVSEGLDLFPDSPLHTASNFQLSPDFRPRASSNASSVGRLSPIPSVYSEPDWTSSYVTNYSLEKLAGNLDETMKLEPYQIFQTSPANHQQQQQQQQTVPPPSYYDTQYQRSNSQRTNTSPYGLPPTPQSATQPRCSIQMNSSPVSGMSPTYQQNETNTTSLSGVVSPSQTQSHSPQQQQQNQNSSQPSKLLNVHIKQEIVDEQETEQQQPQQQLPTQQLQRHQPLHYFVNCRQLQQQRSNHLGLENSSPPETPTSCVDTASTMMGQLMGALNNSALLDDLNINIEGLSGGFDCNVDEVIKHELSMDGTLDFNFQNSLIDSSTIQVNNTEITQNNIMSTNPVVNTVAANSNTGVYVNSNSSTPTAPPSWVH